MIKFTASGRAASATTDEPLTTGSVGVPVEVELSPDFDGLQCTMVCTCGPRSADVALLGQDVTVPAQLLRHAGHWLRLGVWAAREDGTVVIPTVWADVGLVRRGTEPSGVDTAAPAPSWVAQVQQAAADATAVAEAAARGDFDGADGADGFSPTATVTQTDAGATITITDRDGTTTADVANGAGVGENLTPFFSRPPVDGTDPYWDSCSRPGESAFPDEATYIGDGWVHLSYANDTQYDRAMYLCAPKKQQFVRASGEEYTLLIEVRNLVMTHGSGWNPQHSSYTHISYGAIRGAPELRNDGAASGVWQCAEDGAHHASLISQGHYTDGRTTKLIDVQLDIRRYTTMSLDMRVSLYRGDYAGPYVPCFAWMDEQLRDLQQRVVALEGGS